MMSIGIKNETPLPLHHNFQTFSDENWSTERKESKMTKKGIRKRNESQIDTTVSFLETEEGYKELTINCSCGNKIKIKFEHPIKTNITVE